MHDASLIGEGHVGARQNVVGDGLAEDFYPEDIGDAKLDLLVCATARLRKGKRKKKNAHLFRLPLQIRVNQRHMVIAADHIPQRRQSLLYSLNLDCVWDGIPKMLQFLICC